MDILYPLDHLIGKHQDGFERKLASTLAEELFQASTQMVHDQTISFFMLPEPMNFWDANSIR